MKFRVKNYPGEYKELIVEESGTRVESGLLNEAERRSIADSLQEAADELLEGLEPASD